MSDLGAIFHVKKAGVQYDAHAYTPLDECPEPNLKLKYKGQQAYVKLETKGRGDVPCYVRTKAGSVFQVKKEAVTFVNVTITQSANQTIHVYTPQKSGGTDHTSSFTIPKGTSYEAEVIPADGYTAGTLNVNAGGVINSDMTFSASGASEKEKAFIVTAQYYSDSGLNGNIDYSFSYCGFANITDPNNSVHNIGSITPQKIDGFEIITLSDYDYAHMDTETGNQFGFTALFLAANRKCILHIKGKDYRLTDALGDGTYGISNAPEAIGIKNKEKIKVTYTLL